MLLPDGVERVAGARRIPLGIAHLCPACMTVDGKTYGGAGRGVVWVRWGGGSTASPGVAGTSSDMLGGATLAGGHAEGRGPLSGRPSHRSSPQ